ncbi:MAG: hypothetical protein HQ567_24005 [Candidatus Nealsonbacteria bacterium]|nr:hypothetical protein [Candidatus Nealsonbacteria bacterium]
MQCHRTFLLSMVIGLVVAVQGQGFGQPGGVRMITPIQLVGTVAGVRPGMISVTTPAGEVWGLKVPQRAKIKVTGPAEKEVLRKGHFVRFLVTVNKRYSKSVGEVSQMTIFTPSQELGRRVGVFYPGQAEAAAMGPNPGMQPAMPPGMPPLPAAPKGTKPPPPPKEEMFDVRAQVRDIKGKRMTVYVPNKFFKPLLKVELAEDVAIELDLNTYSVVVEGDKLTALGVRIAPKGVEAIQVAIELSTPLTASGRKPTSPIGKGPIGRPGRGDQQQPFEVADDIEREKPKPDEQPDPTPQEDPAEPKESAGDGDQTEQLVAMLEVKPEDAQGRPGLKLSLGGGDQETFLPAKIQPAKAIQEKFGKPDSMQNVNGSLPIGEGGERKDVQWQLWVYGPVKFFVDGDGAVQYFNFTQKK